ncbi:sigma 54-interacting transcriptional regulator, partial [Motilimonas pumila]
RVHSLIARAAPTDANVLVLGENGTGKELVARELHRQSLRADQGMLTVDLGAISEDLIDSELFGHVKGAFTDARTDRVGRIQAAHGGTLFLDEIGDMPMDAQTRLLRVLQQGEFTTVGGARAIKADVRIVAATNKDLAALVQAGQFREDLFYRLNVVPVALPSLRERRDDVPLLARHFL